MPRPHARADGPAVGASALHTPGLDLASQPPRMDALRRQSVGFSVSSLVSSIKLGPQILAHRKIPKYSDPSLGCASRTNTRDTMSGQALRTLKGHTSTIYSVSLSFDGKLLASSSVSRGSREWGGSCCSQPQPA